MVNQLIDAAECTTHFAARFRPLDYVRSRPKSPTFQTLPSLNTLLHNANDRASINFSKLSVVSLSNPVFVQTCLKVAHGKRGLEDAKMFRLQIRDKKFVFLLPKASTFNRRPVCSVFTFRKTADAAKTAKTLRCARKNIVRIFEFKNAFSELEFSDQVEFGIVL